jgi:GDP/UDP-N,N'-diacetylbacillosamine 2-epimerase (hydrolysing)
VGKKMIKKVLAITGIRSEYEILFPVLRKLEKNKHFELKIAVSGAHLSDWHGRTIKTIEKDGFTIADRIDSLVMTDRLTQRVKSVGLLLQGLSQTVDREKPDFLLVVGDREESLATGIVGNYMNTLVAHLSGGDTVFGNADDPVRFAVSRLSHIHFAFAKPYAENLVNAGEEVFRVFCSGDPGLDNINSIDYMDFKQVNEFIGWGIESGKYIVLLNHPLSSEKESASGQMRDILKACKKFCVKNKIKAIGIYPNTDPGSSDIINAINDISDPDHIRFFKTLPRDIFVNVMRGSLALLGNSSMGFLEAPFYELPVVNVGNRQKGRMNAGNVEFVNHSEMKILVALEKACFDLGYRKAVKESKFFYGDGHAAQKIVNALDAIDLQDQKWHIKRRFC